MENQERQVIESITENTEKTAEQTPKTYTQEEFDAEVKKKLDQVMPGKIARQEARIRKEYDKKYGELEGLLKAGTGKASVEEVTDYMRSYYGSRGIQTPQQPEYSQKDTETLGHADADSIIRGGYDEVVEELDRMAKNTANMTARDKAAYAKLQQYRQSQERTRELEQMGVPSEVYNGKDFQDFAAKFSASTPVSEIYGIYEQARPKKEIKTMGSMKSNAPEDSGVKDFYSVEEARKFTKADFDKNPALFAAVQRSMTKWK